MQMYIYIYTDVHPVDGDVYALKKIHIVFAGKDYIPYIAYHVSEESQNTSRCATQQAVQLRHTGY